MCDEANVSLSLTPILFESQGKLGKGMYEPVAFWCCRNWLTGHGDWGKDDQRQDAESSTEDSFEPHINLFFKA
jgi:hypothetical protein